MEVLRSEQGCGLRTELGKTRKESSSRRHLKIHLSLSLSLSDTHTHKNAPLEYLGCGFELFSHCFSFTVKICYIDFQILLNAVNRLYHWIKPLNIYLNWICVTCLFIFILFFLWLLISKHSLVLLSTYINISCVKS